jgi:uncharacterized protein
VTDGRRSGLTLALYPRSELAKDAGMPLPPAGADGFSIGHLVASKEEAGSVLAAAQAAGARLTGPPHERP